MTRLNLETLIAQEARSVAPTSGRDGVWSRVCASLEAGAPAPVAVEPGDPPTFAAAPAEALEIAQTGLRLKVITGLGAVALGALLLSALWPGAERGAPGIGEVARLGAAASEHTLEGAAAGPRAPSAGPARPGGAQTAAEAELEGARPSMTSEDPSSEAGEPAGPRPTPRPRPPKPAVDQPAAPASAPQASELSLVAAAVRQLRREDYGDVLRTVRTLDERYPQGALMEERDGVRALALCGSDSASGEPSAQTFLARYPSSTYAQRVRQSCLP